MKHEDYLRTIDLARAGGLGVQQVRNYEAWGLLPPARRGVNGYRLYTPQHLAALRTARSLGRGYGWQRTLEIMQAIHQDQNQLPRALALIDTRHAELASKRQQAERTLAALRTIAGQEWPRSGGAQPRALRVGEAARQVGVRTSALHFWEEQDLLHPLRDQNSCYRLYDEQQMRRLRVVVLLREANYHFDEIRAVLHEMASGRPEKAIQAVEKRSEELARQSWQCVEGLAALHQYIREYYHEIASHFAR
jgi:DNA-binding transcriptional MerR regulator